MSEGHDHSYGPAPRASRRVRVTLAVALAPFFVATAVGMVVLWPSGEGSAVTATEFLDTSTVHDATVLETAIEPCQGGGVIASSSAEDENSVPLTQCMTMTVRIDDGPEQGDIIELPTMGLGGIAPDLQVDDEITLARSEIPGQAQPVYNYADLQRESALLLLAALFVAIVIGIARVKGLSALIGLGITLLILIKFILPSILMGNDPIAVALVGSSASMIVILYLTHGVSARTAAALLGTLVSLLFTALLAVTFVDLTRITGQSQEEHVTLALAGSTVTVTGLLLAGIIIGALGVLNDVTVTQASAVWELHRANPDLGGKQIYRSVMRIGRDHIASVVDTLVLAYAGASLPLLVLFAVAPKPLGTILSGEIVAIEVLRTLVGSIGLVLSVPITTALAALVVTRSRDHRLASGDEPTGDGTSTSSTRGRSRLATAAQERGAGLADSMDEPVEPDWQPPRAERQFWDDTDRDDTD